MRTWLRGLTLMVVLAVVPAVARAGPSIANPRGPDLRPEVFDSLQVRRFECGVLLGTPAGLNIGVGYWPDRVWGVRASGLYLGSGIGGVQGNLCRTIRRSATKRTALALVVGTMQSDSGEGWTYGGAAIDWNLRGLYLETGLVYGDGHLELGGDTIESAVQLIAQFGFLSGGGVHGPR